MLDDQKLIIFFVSKGNLSLDYLASTEYTLHSTLYSILNLFDCHLLSSIPFFGYYLITVRLNLMSLPLII
jgi:hypothetical protein